MAPECISLGSEYEVRSGGVLFILPLTLLIVVHHVCERMILFSTLTWERGEPIRVRASQDWQVLADLLG